MTVSEIERKLALLQHDCQSLASLDGIEKGERRAVKAIVSQIANIRHELTAALSDQVVVRRGWLTDVRDQMIKMKLESGPAGDFIFLLREMLTDILDRPAAPPPACPAGEVET